VQASVREFAQPALVQMVLAKPGTPVAVVQEPEQAPPMLTWPLQLGSHAPPAPRREAEGRPVQAASTNKRNKKKCVTGRTRSYAATNPPWKEGL
jgi:hypothetical protein